MKVALLVLSLLAAAPHGAVIAAPDEAPPAAAPPAAPPPAAGAPAAAPPARSPPAPAPPAPAPEPGTSPGSAPQPAVPPSPTEPAVLPPPPATAPAPASPATIGPPSQASPAARSTAAAEEPEPGELSPFIAFSLSFAMPIALVAGSVTVMDVDGGGGIVFVASLIAGPSSGFFYAGRPITGLATAATRLAGLYLFSAVLDDRPGRSEGRVTIGALMVVAATLTDWIGAPLATAAHNERVRARGGATIVPTAQPGGAGLSIVGSF